MKYVVMDITELVGNPIRTGIQRVVRELIRYWPDPAHLKLARFDASRGLVALPESVLPLLLDDEKQAKEATADALKEYLAKQLLHGGEPRLPTDAVVLIPELFYDPLRCLWYLDRIRQDSMSVFCILYDFIPWLYPDRIGVTATAPFMHYLRLVREANRTAFISGQTQSDYATRIRRNGSVDFGPVLPLGADGLGLNRQTFAEDKRAWVSIGAINGNKNQHLIHAAFHKMWNAGFDGELVLIGRVFGVDSSAWLKDAGSSPKFRHLVDVSDEVIRIELSKARATIYVSGVEGFGLPPVESLHAGIPVIVTKSIPSIADLPHEGQIRLSSASVSEIADAVQVTADDEAASRLWEQAAMLKLATWRDFAVRTAEWIQG
jgi:glycosyltransferase involved in cell wall biosynthesis